MTVGKDCCEIYCFDESKVTSIRQVLEDQNIEGMVRIFKVLADETRMKIAYALCEADELCVCDVANITGATLATASHHLRTLHQQGLTKFRKEGKLVFYSLDDDHVEQLIRMVSTHSKELKENG